MKRKEEGLGETEMTSGPRLAFNLQHEKIVM